MKRSTKGINAMGITNSNAIEFGYGIFKIGYNGEIGYGHFGDQDGFFSTSIYFPERNLSFTYLANSIKSSTTQESVASALLGVYFNNTN